MLENQNTTNTVTGNQNSEKVLKNFLLDLIDMVEQIELECLVYIKKRKYKLIVKKQQKFILAIYRKYENILPLELGKTPEWGENLVFEGNTGKYLFPSFLYASPTSYNEYKDLFKKLQQNNYATFLTLQRDIFNILYQTANTKTAGFNAELMETLTFITSRFHGFDTINDIDLSDLSLKNYHPYYLTELDLSIIKKSAHVIYDNLILVNLAISNPQFWNLGAFLIKGPEEPTDLPVFPYWLLTDTAEQPLYTVNRIAPADISKVTPNIITSLGFFINFNQYSSSNSSFYTYKLPNLLETYEQYTEQKYILKDIIDGRNNQYLQQPNWKLEIKSPVKNTSRPKIIENDSIDAFLLDKYDSIVHSVNRRFENELITIMELNKKNNVFTQMFYNRIRLLYTELRYELIIDLYDLSKSNQTFKQRIKDFLTAVMPTGFFIEYEKGILFLCLVKDDSKKDIATINDFLTFLNISFTIVTHTEMQNQSFLIYTMPPSIYYSNGTWNFPERKTIPTVAEFKQVNAETNRLELERLQDKDFSKRLEEFQTFIKK